MQGWYQFGYDGFPSGEARQRFYRQRDDPCDSEEDQEAYDGNDRPVYYYPIHESEEVSPMLEEDELDEGDILLSLPSTSPSLLRVSAWDRFPGRFGSTAVPLKGVDSGGDQKGDACFLLHGGVVTVTEQVTNTSEVLSVGMHVDSITGHEAVSVVEPDPSLAELICLTSLGFFSGEAEVSATSYAAECPPRRFGHSAAVVSCSSEANTRFHLCHTNCELHFVLIIGGAFGNCVPKTLHDVHIRDSVICDPWLCITLLRDCRKSGEGNTYTATPLSLRPTKKAHWTVHIPLPGLSPFIATPRVFATLTEWPISERDSKTVSYAYLGGSVNGWDPLPLFGLWLLHVNTANWTLSTSLLETFGEEPPSRFGHSAVLVHSQELYVFGGIGARRTYLNDLMVLNCITKVWREIFVPSLFLMPPRAFHSSVLMSCPLRAILIIGGEAEGHHEPSIWKYSLDRGVWSLVTFPLLDRTFSLFSGREYDSPVINQVIVATQLLCERERLITEKGDTSGCVHLRRRMNSHCMNQNNTNVPLPQDRVSPSKCCRTSFSSPLADDASMTSLSSFYFAAMHGSLLQVLQVGNGIMILGGTKSPCVTSLSWIPSRDYSLKENAAFWICRYRVKPFLDMRLGARSQSGTDAFNDLADGTESKQDKRCIDLMERSLAEDQLDQWRRNARKHLRSE